ncbi:MAG: hypothetical protein AB1733_03505 [Thermodesulfobacteriota bacterium]
MAVIADHKSHSRAPSLEWIAALVLPLVIAALFPVLSYLYFPRDLLWDDAALTLKYVDNLSSGHGYRFNATDPLPIFGASSFLFTVTAAALKLIPVLNQDFLYIRLPGLIGYFLTLFLSYRFLYRKRGLVAGFLGMATIGAVPQYFGVASSGLETMMGAAIISAAIFLFYFQEHERLFLVCCTGLVMTKLDLTGASLLLALGHLAVVYSGDRNRFQRSLARAILFYGVPVALFFIFCRVYFGSVIPHSLQAKLIYSYDTTGYPYLRAFLATSSLYRFYILLSLVPLGALLFVCLREKTYPSFRFLVVLVASLSLLVQVCITPFREIFPWYFHVPFLSWQIAVLLALEESLALSPTLRTRLITYGSLAVLSFMLVLGVTSPNVGPPSTFSSKIQAVKRWLDLVESQRRAIGALVARTGKPEHVLSTGYGWSAYDSGMRVFDPFGINTREPVEEKWGLSGWLNNLSAYKPDFIVCHKQTHPSLASQYDLIALGWNPRLMGHSEWEVYRRKESAIPYERMTFPDLGKAFPEPAATGVSVKRSQITRYDYALVATARGATMRIEGLKLDNSIVGFYCYVEVDEKATADKQAEVTIETNVPGHLPVKVPIRWDQGIVLVTTRVAARVNDGHIRITATVPSESGSTDSTGPAIHVRDLFVTQGSF